MKNNEALWAAFLGLKPIQWHKHMTTINNHRNPTSDSFQIHINMYDTVKRKEKNIFAEGETEEEKKVSERVSYFLLRRKMGFN